MQDDSSGPMMVFDVVMNHDIVDVIPNKTAEISDVPDMLKAVYRRAFLRGYTSALVDQTANTN